MCPSCRSACAPSLRKPLVACVIAILGLPASVAFAGTVVVNNCNDSGTGILRWAVGPTVAASGDSIDMTGLTAASASSRITLSTGEIDNRAAATGIGGCAGGVSAKKVLALGAHEGD